MTEHANGPPPRAVVDGYCAGCGRYDVPLLAAGRPGRLRCAGCLDRERPSSRSRHPDAREDPDGHQESVAAATVAAAAEPVCDFCAGRPVVAAYPARAFELFRLGDVVGLSEGWWAADAPCRALIERGDRDGLARRSAETSPLRGRVPDDVAAAAARSMHALFWENRTGPVVGLDPN